LYIEKLKEEKRNFILPEWLLKQNSYSGGMEMKFETQKYRIKVSLLKEKGGDKACFSLEKIERLKNGHLKYDGKDKETKYFGNKIVINKEDQLEIYDGDKLIFRSTKIEMGLNSLD